MPSAYQPRSFNAWLLISNNAGCHCSTHQHFLKTKKKRESVKIFHDSELYPCLCPRTVCARHGKARHGKAVYDSP